MLLNCLFHSMQKQFVTKALMTELYSLHTITLTAPDTRLPMALSAAVEGLSGRKARTAVTAGLVSSGENVLDDPTFTLSEDPLTVQLDLRQGLKPKVQQENTAPFTILYEDDHIVIVNKAVGVLSAPKHAGDHGHIPELVRAHYRKQGKKTAFIGSVHRIDQNTSGCLVLALSKKAQSNLATQFAIHGANRRYRCLLIGQPKQNKDTIRADLGHGPDGRRWIVKPNTGGKEAITHFTVEQRYANGSDVSIRLETGRTHQIRIHMAAIGCPIYGDDLYSVRAKKDGKLAGLPTSTRLMLHAHRIDLDHPHTGKRISIEAPVPESYTDFIRRLGKIK